jgi:RNA polymerase sigma factor (sigma-70 family)
MEPELAATLQALHPDAFGWALHCCHGDAGRAEDVLQTAYLKIASQRVQFRAQSSFQTWWFGIIRFTAREEHRRAWFRRALAGKLLSRHGEEAPHPAASHQVEVDEEAAQVRQALRQLPARQAEVLHLVFYQDLTLQAAATVLGIRVGSVRQHYERGKARLREILSPPSPCHYE